MKEVTPGKLDSRPAEAVPQILPVILAGGSGTHLWPLWRERYPKQMIELIGDESLLSSTACRLDGLDKGQLAAELLVVCGEHHKFMCATPVRSGNKGARVMLEPAARNTAPALTLAALEARARHGDPVLAVMTADHAVADRKAFQYAVAQAAIYAQDNAIVALGVLPRRAETGYGYIKLGALMCGTRGPSRAHLIERFVEKPHHELAQEYLRTTPTKGVPLLFAQGNKSGQSLIEKRTFLMQGYSMISASAGTRFDAESDTRLRAV